MTEWKHAGCHGNDTTGASCTHTVCASHSGRTTFSHLPLGSWLRNPDPDVMLMKPAGLVLDSGSERGGRGVRRAAQSEAAAAFRPLHPEASCWLVYTQLGPSRAWPRRLPCPRCSPARLGFSRSNPAVLSRWRAVCSWPIPLLWAPPEPTCGSNTFEVTEQSCVLLRCC